MVYWPGQLSLLGTGGGRDLLFVRPPYFREEYNLAGGAVPRPPPMDPTQGILT